jgi:CheY-like chemotaxis protein
MKILIIDPNRPFQQSLQKLLAKHFSHIDVEVAGDGDEGLKKLEAFRPDLIFLEIHLAGKSGLKLARRIKSEHPEMIIAVLTSYDLPEYQTAVKESGLEYLIPKDIWTGKDMIKLVESIITNSDILRS